MSDASGTEKPIALEAREIAPDGRKFSPSVGRNRDVIGRVFAETMPHAGEILEIASGTGEHGAHMVSTLPSLHWTYSDIDDASRSSQMGWQAHLKSTRLKGPLFLDTRAKHWGAAEQAGAWAGLFCANMIHIAPIQAAEGLFAGAGRLLAPEGRLMLYGPFARAGEIHESNAQFDASLKRRDSEWGVRDLDLELLPLAGAAGLVLHTIIDMPANNHSVIFSRQQA